MKKYILLLLLTFPVTVALTCYGQIISDNAVSEEQLKSHVYFLASDSLNGRGIGTTENNLAANYLKDQLQKMNVKGPDAQFFQHFFLTSASFDSENSFIHTYTHKGKLKKPAVNFIPLFQETGTLDIEGEIIYAGFGINTPELKGSDEEKNTYRGKIVMYSSGSPGLMKQQSNDQWNSALERKKMDQLLDAGAKALLLVTGTGDPDNMFYHQLAQRRFRHSYTLNPEKDNEQKKVFIITPQNAGKLLGKKSGWEKLLRTNPEGNPDAVAGFGINRIHIRSEVKSRQVEAKNVIGIIEGSDSLLKSECIVFVAHYDHIKSDSPGVIFNGADDNASGVAALLEVARMFSLPAEKPRRSIVFLFPTAEETGLLGSEYYSLNPVIPLDKTIACVNLDMVGRVYEERDSVWDGTSKPVKDFNGIYALVNNFSPSLKAITEEACAQLDLEPDFSLPARFFYSSDHYHFHKNSVPVLNLSTGYTADYHKETDTPDRIRTDKIKRVVRLCLRVATELDNLK